jgi:hypothetical protein
MVALIPILLPTVIETVQQLYLGHPQYSPDLAASDFLLFGPLRDASSGLWLVRGHELKEVMHIWLAMQSKTFYSNAISLCSAVPSVLKEQGLC